MNDPLLINYQIHVHVVNININLFSFCHDKYYYYTNLHFLCDGIVPSLNNQEEFCLYKLLNNLIEKTKQRTTKNHLYLLLI